MTKMTIEELRRIDADTKRLRKFGQDALFAVFPDLEQDPTIGVEDVTVDDDTVRIQFSDSEDRWSNEHDDLYIPAEVFCGGTEAIVKYARDNGLLEKGLMSETRSFLAANTNAGHGWNDGCLPGPQDPETLTWEKTLEDTARRYPEYGGIDNLRKLMVKDRFCRKCGSPVFKETRPASGDYPFFCINCEENMFAFETFTTEEGEER